ncbi:hypothetical protein V501_00556 [Pseudogymnoascus sp. VKM F-4519 (FW-2642)]|nr:hypothetical protein V501_00556 [Pseudogymnoascus sp. VKM F-4519 (FW-2642)]
MTLSYIPLFTVTYFFWWHKPKDVLTPSIVTLPDMSEEQKRIFRSMTISNKFDNKGMEDQVTYCDFRARTKLVEFYGATAFTYAVAHKLLYRPESHRYLTARVFEKEAEDMRALEQAAEKAAQTVTERAMRNAQANPGAHRGTSNYVCLMFFRYERSVIRQYGKQILHL